MTYPEVNRNLKGPRLAPSVRADFDSLQPGTIGNFDEAHHDGQMEAALPHGAEDVNAPALDPGGSVEEAAAQEAAEGARKAHETVSSTEASGEEAESTSAGEDASAALIDDESASLRAARVHFGTAPLGGTPSPIEPWAPGAAPVIETEDDTSAAAVTAPDPLPQSNRTVVTKGEIDFGVSGNEDRIGEGLKSPAERLRLVGETRARQEKCLADAIYFEARGEPVRGQMAVAQVVVNRVFSGHYPGTVCGVVYQNAHRHLACQFTFACDGIADRINEPAAWERAKHIARDTLDGRFWLPDIGKATHYHAYWVHPWWVHEMRKLDRIGVHTFYRPRNWGDGAKAPVWGDSKAAEVVAKAL
jgi:spore germination cell wall hydrolase CwlJ-like protein